MSRVGLAHVPNDLVAAIVRRAFSDSSSTLQARLDLSLVSRAWQAALTGSEVTHEFRGRITAPQLVWLVSTRTRLASLNFAAVGGGGKGADPGSARLLLDPEALSASAGSLAALRNLAVPLNASGFAALRRLGDRFGALRTLGIIIDTQARMAPGTAAVAVMDARLSEVLCAVPAAVEVLDVTFLVDMFVAVEGVWLSHVHALRRLHLSGPCLEALFCDVAGLPASLEEVSINLPQGEVSVVVDDRANCLSQPLQACGSVSAVTGDAKSSATSVLWRAAANGRRKELRLTITDARQSNGRRTPCDEEAEQDAVFAALQAPLVPGRDRGLSDGARSGGLLE